ncbi:hypothetical protein ABK040_005503 [Willaertia magna]
MLHQVGNMINIYHHYGTSKAEMQKHEQLSLKRIYYVYSFINPTANNEDQKKYPTDSIIRDIILLSSTPLSNSTNTLDFLFHCTIPKNDWKMLEEISGSFYQFLNDNFQLVLPQVDKKQIVLLPNFSTKNHWNDLKEVIQSSYNEHNNWNHYSPFETKFLLYFLGINNNNYQMNLYEVLQKEYKNLLNKQKVLLNEFKTFKEEDIFYISKEFNEMFYNRKVLINGNLFEIQCIDLLHYPYFDKPFRNAPPLRQFYKSQKNIELQKQDSPLIYIKRANTFINYNSYELFENIYSSFKKNYIDNNQSKQSLVFPIFSNLEVCSAEVTTLLFDTTDFIKNNILSHIVPTVDFILNNFKEEFELIELEDKLKVQFQDKSLLKQALIHPSFADLHHLPYSLERLEYLGDSVLALLATHFYFEHLKEARYETLIISSSLLTTNETFRTIADIDLNLMKYIKIDTNTSLKKYNRKKEKISSDVFESIVGALYVDKGLTSCRWFTTNYLKMQHLDQEDSLHSYEIAKKYYDSLIKEQQTNNIHLLNIWEKVSLLEKQLGFEFNDKFLLLEALIHPSASFNIKKLFSIPFNIEYDYRRLKVLGESILKFIVASHVYFKFPQEDEGKLTSLALESSKVSNLYKAAVTLNLNDCLIYENVEDGNTIDKDNTKALVDLVKALIGAIYIDRGIFELYSNQREYDIYDSFIHKYILEHSQSISPENLSIHPNTLIQNIVLKLFQTIVIWKESKKKICGKLFFEAELRTKNKSIVLSRGYSSKKANAREDASQKAIRCFIELSNHFYLEELTLDNLLERIELIKSKLPNLLENDFVLNDSTENVCNSNEAYIKCQVCHVLVEEENYDAHLASDLHFHNSIRTKCK